LIKNQIFKGAVMKATIAIVFAGLGYLLQYLGSMGVIFIFLYGIYSLFMTSISIGLMMIGLSVVGGWFIQLIATILFSIGVSIAQSVVIEKDDS